MFDLGIIEAQIYLDSSWQELNLYIKDGKVAALSKNLLSSREEILAKGKFVIPGLIDPHVHLDMQSGPIRTADDFLSGSKLALSGGVTTIIDFLDPAQTAKEIEKNFYRRKKEARSSLIDFAFYTSLGTPKDSIELVAELALNLGTPTIKTYTTYGKSSTPDDYLEDIIAHSAKEDILMICHAERDELLRPELKGAKNHSLSRPSISEIDQILSLAHLTDYHKSFSYIAHLSCGTALELVRNKFPDLLQGRIFFESCPQYFTLNNTVYDGEDAYLYRICPPFREPKEQDRLRKNIAHIDCLATDHCPFSRDQKKGVGNFIPMGTGSLGRAFQQLYSDFGSRVIDKFTKNTAKIHGLYPKKGSLMPGSDADIVIFSEKKDGKNHPNFSRSDYSIYDETREKLLVETVFCEGQKAFHMGRTFPRQGNFLKRELSLRTRQKALLPK